jgi:hypothetical protein
MATPNITSATIASEGLRRSGFPDPTAEQIKRAKEIWMPELVNEIISKTRATGFGVLKTFETTVLAIGIVNQRRYALPTDFDDELNVTLLDGDVTDTVQSANSTTVTLAAGETVSESDAEGRHILITTGVGKGQYRQITDYDSTTKVVTMDIAWDTGKTPSSSDTYVIVNEEDAVGIEYVKVIDESRRSRTPGMPTCVTIHNNEFIFNSPLDKTYGMKVRYYADPAKIDFDDARWTDLFTRWQHLLTLGVQRVAMDELDDSRTPEVTQNFTQELVGTIRREQPEYGEFEGFILGD